MDKEGEKTILWPIDLVQISKARSSVDLCERKHRVREGTLLTPRRDGHALLFHLSAESWALFWRSRIHLYFFSCHGLRNLIKFRFVSKEYQINACTVKLLCRDLRDLPCIDIYALKIALKGTMSPMLLKTDFKTSPRASTIAGATSLDTSLQFSFIK